MAVNKTAVLGIGNTLLTDEGAGVHAMHLLQSEYPDLPNTDRKSTRLNSSHNRESRMPSSA